MRALEQVRAFVEENVGRFAPFNEPQNKWHLTGPLAGFRDDDELSHGYRWLVLKSVFKHEVCRGLPARQVELLLIERGWQGPGNGGRTTRNIATCLGQQRVHVLSPLVLSDDI